MPDTRAASRVQKRKRGVPASGDSIQSTVNRRTIQSPPAIADDRHTKKKRKSDSNAQPPDTPLATQNPRLMHAPSGRGEANLNANHSPPSAVNATGANAQVRADMTDFTAQIRQDDWRHLLDCILQELRETFSPAGRGLPSAAETFLCELLSAILLRSYRTYSLEKLFGQGNSGPHGAVKDAIKQDNLEMSFEAVAAFAAQNGYKPIENVRGNRASKDLVTGAQFFECIWGNHPISRKHWDTADFREQYRRICKELAKPEPARNFCAKFKRTLQYRFFQSQTIFSYPDPNGTFASTGKGPKGEGPHRKVWYHQTHLPSKDVPMEGVRTVVRCNENPTRDGEEWKPRRVLEEVESWDLVKSSCERHRLRFAASFAN